jgi:hypothetical protein
MDSLAAGSWLGADWIGDCPPAGWDSPCAADAVVPCEKLVQKLEADGD